MIEKKLEEMTDVERAAYWEKQFDNLKKETESYFIKKLLTDIVEKGEGLLKDLEEVPVHTLTCMGIFSENVDILFKSQLKKWVSDVKAYNERK